MSARTTPLAARGGFIRQTYRELVDLIRPSACPPVGAAFLVVHRIAGGYNLAGCSADR